MRKEKDILVLGAGKRTNPNAINHDRLKHSKDIDVVWDLDILPWPWEDCRFHFIEARAVFEHLKIGLLRALDECWRIFKKDGTLFLKLPYWNSERCWDDPTHKRGYTKRSLNWVDPDTDQGKQYSYYTNRKWKIIKVNYNPQKTSLFWKLKVRK